MNLNSPKTMIATATLFLFLVVAALTGLQWPVLWIPGALLMWYGAVAAASRNKIAVQNQPRSGLN